LLSSIGSGVATIKGLSTAFVGQSFFVLASSSLTTGLIVNLTRSSKLSLNISALLLESCSRIFVGGKVMSTPYLFSLPIGDYVVGAILDPLGSIILLGSASNTTSLRATVSWLVESPSVGMIFRQSVFEPLQTGLLCVDAMIPIGRGQRELILGDRYTGKTAIGIDAMINQRYEKVLCVYASIGIKAATVLEVFLSLSSKQASRYLTMLVATSSSSAIAQFYSAYTSASIADYFMLFRKMACLVLFDDLTRHAVSYREIYLLLRRPPGREAYPGEIFFVHSRLLERSAMVSETIGGGSVTALPVIETLGGDVSAYITTNVISITDGQIFLATSLFLSGIRPSVDVGLSVTRVGSAAQWDGMKLVGSSYKLELAQFTELQSFSQFSSDLGAETKRRLARGRTLVEMLKQPNLSPLPLSKQLTILSVAGQGLLDSLELSSLRNYLTSLSSVPQWILLFLPPRIIAKVLN
jgi:F-type H+-transporting ATPase subunit alpha